MPLSAPIRKQRLGFGKQKEIAHRLGVSETYVSNVVAGAALPRTHKGWRSYRRVQVAVARSIGLPLADVFADAERANAPTRGIVAA